MRKREQQSEYHSTPAYHRPFKPREPWLGVTETGKQHAAEIRRMIEAFAHKKPDRSWAPKLLARVAAGEHIAPYCVQMALDVAGPSTQREPGSDDE